MDFERIKIVLSNCRGALRLLHPIMNSDEPCVICEAYTEAGKLLIDLEDYVQEKDFNLEVPICTCGGFMQVHSKGIYMRCVNCGGRQKSLIR